MASQTGWTVFLGVIFLLLLSFTIYFVRYPIWSWTVEPIMVALILSYAAVLTTALALLKLDLKRRLHEVLAFHDWQIMLLGVGLAFLFETIWYGVALALGAKVVFISFPFLRGYELYAYASLPLAFILYAVFSTFGAFAEEVTYRGYVMPRISSRYDVVVGILFSAVFFALQHIHVFQLPWIMSFFQGQFVVVICFGLFAGYFFWRTKGDIWSVFVFHTLGNLFGIALPIHTTYAPYIGWASTVSSYVVLFLVLRFVPLGKKHPWPDKIRD
jgi:membrane protease YdiL (CAAX protease family)